MKHRYSRKLWSLLLPLAMTLSLTASVVHVYAQDESQEQPVEQTISNHLEESAEEQKGSEANSDSEAPAEESAKQLIQESFDSLAASEQISAPTNSDELQIQIQTASEDAGESRSEPAELNIEYTIPIPVDGANADDYQKLVASNPDGMAQQVLFADYTMIPDTTYVKGETVWAILYTICETKPQSISVNGKLLDLLEDSGNETTMLYLYGSESFAVYSESDQAFLVFCYVYEPSENAAEISIQMPELFDGMTNEELFAGVQTTPAELVLTEASIINSTEQSGIYNSQADGYILLTYDCATMPACVLLNGSPLKIDANIYVAEFALMGDEPLAIYFMQELIVLIPTSSTFESQPFSLTTPSFTQGMTVEEAGIRTVVSLEEAVLDECEFKDQDLNSRDSYAEGDIPWIQYTYTIPSRPSKVTVNGKELPLIKSAEDYLQYHDGDKSYGFYILGRLTILARIEDEPAEPIDVAIETGVPAEGMHIDDFVSAMAISPSTLKYEIGLFGNVDDSASVYYSSGQTEWACIEWSLTAPLSSVSLNGSVLKVISFEDEEALEEASNQKKSFAAVYESTLALFLYCPSDCVHMPVEIKGFDADCTSTGLTAGERCSKCGEVLNAQTVIPALGHAEEIIPGKEATCTETGWTEGTKCSRCSETLKAQTVIPALGHEEEIIPGREATPTEKGLTDGIQCSRCNEILKVQEEVEYTEPSSCSPLKVLVKIVKTFCSWVRGLFR